MFRQSSASENRAPTSSLFGSSPPAPSSVNAAPSSNGFGARAEFVSSSASRGSFFSRISFETETPSPPLRSSGGSLFGVMSPSTSLVAGSATGAGQSSVAGSGGLFGTLGGPSPYSAGRGTISGGASHHRPSSDIGGSLSGSGGKPNGAGGSGLFGGASLFGQAKKRNVGGHDLFSDDEKTAAKSTGRSGNIFSPPAGHIDSLFGETDENPNTKARSHTADLRVTEGQAVDFGFDILTLNVGEDEHQKSFTMHANLLTARSCYFRNALLQHPEQRSFNFPTIDPRAFALYFQLIYTNCLPSKSNEPTNSTHDEYSLLCKLHTLAHTLQDCSAANAALSAIFTKASGSTELPASEHVWMIYKDIQGPCGARMLLVDLYTFAATGPWMKDQGQGFPAEFLCDLAMSLVENRRPPEGMDGRGGMGGRRGVEDYYEA